MSNFERLLMELNNKKYYSDLEFETYLMRTILIHMKFTASRMTRRNCLAP